MNLQETGTVLDVLETAYPRMFSGPGTVDREKALGLWAKMFEDDRVDLVAAAVKSYIATDAFLVVPRAEDTAEPANLLQIPFMDCKKTKINAKKLLPCK